MSEKLQEAIAATRAGEKREAQRLLTELLQENPNDEYGWFLLGNLVDSPEKRMAYLGKALTINPHNEKARQQITHIQRQVIATSEAVEEPVVVMVKEDEVTAVVENVAEIPDWLKEQHGDELAEGEATDVELLETMDAIVDEEEAETEMAVAQTAAATPPKTVTKSDREQQLTRYNQILAFLIVLIIITLIALIWSL